MDLMNGKLATKLMLLSSSSLTPQNWTTDLLGALISLQLRTEYCDAATIIKYSILYTSFREIIDLIVVLMTCCGPRIREQEVEEQVRGLLTF